MVASFAGGALLFAWFLLHAARKADAANWILARAPELPIALLNVRDDAWVRGTARCQEPLKIPVFGKPCLLYDYVMQEKVRTTTGSGKNRRTSTKWVTREHLKDASDFDIVQGGAAIRIHAAEAETDGLSFTGYEYSSLSYRHSAHYLPYPCEVSALGSVSEHKAWLEAHANIPLLLTPRTRAEFLRRKERGEGALRWSGFILLFLASAGLMVAGLTALTATAGEPFWNLGRALAGIAIGASAFGSVWAISTFNRMLTYRTRTEAAWKHVDVDLKHRHDLVPRLVEVIQGALAHERELLETIARARAAARVSEHVAAAVERYPELSSNALFLQLQGQLRAIEDKIAHDRAFFDECAAEFNTFIQQQPRALLARLAGFEERALFGADGAERAVPAFKVIGARRGA